MNNLPFTFKGFNTSRLQRDLAVVILDVS